MFNKKILLPHQYYYPEILLQEDLVTPCNKTEFISALNVAKSSKVLLYVHFPFCDSHCAFCGFDKRYNLDEIQRYVDRLKEELLFYSKYGFQIQNIHFGGGTPTLTPGPLLKEIIDFVREHYVCSPDMDINIEGSCTSIYRDDIIQFIKECGITRTSIGVQTFNPRMREVFQCKATLDQVYTTIETLKKNQIGVFTDILFGYPDFHVGKPPEEIVWEDLQEAIRLEVDGIDFSQIFPYGNKLSGLIEKNNLSFAKTEQLTSFMQRCMDLMEANGYVQQTNYGFVRQGRIIMETSYYGGSEAVSDTLAIGCSAFGMLNGYKYRNAMYSSYMRREIPRLLHVKKLTDLQLNQIDIVGFSKLLVLSKEVLNQSSQKARFLVKLDALISAGMVSEEKDCYRLTRLGRLYVDNIYYYMLDDAERSIIQNELRVVTFD